MPAKPCKCSDGHRYSRTQAKDLGFVCKKDGQPITCPVLKSASASSGKPKSGAGKPRHGR
jgi:hypothetical protein